MSVGPNNQIVEWWDEANKLPGSGWLSPGERIRMQLPRTIRDRFTIQLFHDAFGYQASVTFTLVKGPHAGEAHCCKVVPTRDPDHNTICIVPEEFIAMLCLLP